MNKKVLILSCEHAVNSIPKEYQSLFSPHKELLNSHRGIDFGALEIALHLQKIFSCDLVEASASRLLIDCNRSLHNQCFSEITKNLPNKVKQEIIERFYWPYRKELVKRIENQHKQGNSVIHCSIHSFTPIFNNKERHADIGFLYDPQRVREKIFSLSWKQELKKRTNQYRIRMNYPYQGKSDGFTKVLRTLYPPEAYLGIEIESNQAITRKSDALIRLKNIFAESLAKLLQCAKSP